MRALDTEMIEQRDVVCRVSLPAVGCADRRARLAGVALVHRDNAKVLRELDGGIEGTLMPELDARAHPAGREQQDRITGAEFFEVKADVAAFEGRHDWSS